MRTEVTYHIIERTHRGLSCDGSGDKHRTVKKDQTTQMDLPMNESVARQIAKQSLDGRQRRNRWVIIKSIRQLT